jgi:hypothetical protein
MFMLDAAFFRTLGHGLVASLSTRSRTEHAEKRII